MEIKRLHNDITLLEGLECAKCFLGEKKQEKWREKMKFQCLNRKEVHASEISLHVC